MKKIGIFFGTDTGNTEKVAYLIHEQFGYEISGMFNISEIKKKDIDKYNIVMFGIPTWYYGELQCDWEDFLPVFKTINFKNKIVAFFGCGDQEDYSEYFCNGMRIIYDLIIKKGAKCIGKWKNEGYSFKSSTALLNEKYFLGLTIDEDRQSDLTEERVYIWVNSIKKELKLFE